jgi:colanic acid/amylovoran biosynthesis glycosyltransferase
VGRICIVGVDNDVILKDFVRAHVDYLRGEKVLVDHWYPDLRHNGYTIRHFYASNKTLAKIRKLFPQALYTRVVTRNELSEPALNDSFNAFFREHDVDIVLAEFGPTGADLAPHLEKLGIPLVVHFHGHDAHRRHLVDDYRTRYAEMFRIAARIVCVSRFMQMTLEELGADPAKIVLNPYGPRDAFFSVKPRYNSTVLAVGRFTDIKANYLTLAAFAEAARSVPEARLVMVGNGELLETCKTLARHWGVSELVSFPGAVPHSEILAFFEDACCFAQHSVTPSYGDAEGTPVAILEAAAAALPIVATRHAGIVDAVIHGETGFLVDEGDVIGMAAAMKLFLNDAQLSSQMGERARTHTQEQFSMARHIDVLQNVIDDARRTTTGARAHF